MATKYGHWQNPVILSRLRFYFEARDWGGLTDYLGKLSHRDFQCAGAMIGEKIMPEVTDEIFWIAFRTLLSYHSKAFLMTMLKAVPLRKERGFSLRQKGFLEVADYLKYSGSDIDQSKFIGFMLKVFDEDVEELEYLFAALHVESPRIRLEYLLKGEGLACYYLLFKAMRQLEHEKDLLVRCCMFLIKRGDSLSFNLASISKIYFDLPQVKGTFSLQLSPYHLGRLEISFDSFKKVMLSI